MCPDTALEFGEIFTTYLGLESPVARPLAGCQIPVAGSRNKKNCSTLRSPSYPSATGDSEARREGWVCAR
eukprot:scaffold18419_cov98-Isochrysis_galbana.AAC.1